MARGLAWLLMADAEPVALRPDSGRGTGVATGEGQEDEMQAYSDPSREDDDYALPDIEVFEADDYPPEDGAEPLAPGWYWWSCFPGCLPDSEPCGPFETEAEALADAQSGMDDWGIE